jgi:hypothetical protein
MAAGGKARSYRLKETIEDEIVEREKGGKRLPVNSTEPTHGAR